MMKSFVFCFFVIGTAMSCSPGSSFQEIDIFQEFPEPIALTPDKEYHFQLGYPVEYLIIDSLLFTLEIKQDQFIRCINLNTEEEISFFLNKGRGVGELINCLSIRYISDSIQVYGEPLTILQFAVSDVLKGIRSSDYRAYHMQGNLLVRSNALKLDEKTALFPGTIASSEDEYRFYLYDFDTAEYRTFGNYHPDFYKNMEIKPQSKSLINQSLIQLHPDDNRFVVVTPFFKSIEVYDMNTYQIIDSRYYELPKADIQKNGPITLVFSSNEQSGFRVYCTKRAIYCFYIEPTQTEELNKTVYVFVYDWHLKPLACYTMTAADRVGYVTADDRYIYTSIIDPTTAEYIFCRYKTCSTF